MAGLSGSVKVYLALHAYGQYFMFPYGYTEQPSPHYDVQVRMSVQLKCRWLLLILHSCQRRWPLRRNSGKRLQSNMALLIASDRRLQQSVSDFDRRLYGTVHAHYIAHALAHADETSGNSVDWAYTNQSIVLAYTVEFRDRGTLNMTRPTKSCRTAVSSSTAWWQWCGRVESKTSCKT